MNLLSVKNFYNDKTTNVHSSEKSLKNNKTLSKTEVVYWHIV